MSISNNDIIKCNFNNTLTITYSKIESNIINGKTSITAVMAVIFNTLAILSYKKVS
mgnify:CR=1 FL=1